MCIFETMRLLSILFLLALQWCVNGQIPSLIPIPAVVKSGKGIFTITESTILVAKNKQDSNSVRFLNYYLQTYYGFKLPVRNSAPSNYIELTTSLEGHSGSNYYELHSNEKNISINGNTPAATFYGLQTLLQLLPVQKTKSLNLKGIHIRDSARFAYRGMHLDVARHFFPVSFIKKYIDYLALHKFNTFHWHLTEDQGWRIEIKKYPELTQKGAWRNGTITGKYPGNGNDGKHYGGYYTQEDIKEIVQYASERYIEIIPEIELPGHSSAAIAAYPELSCFPQEPSKMYYPKKCKWFGDSTGKQVQQTWGVFDDVYCAGKENTFTFIENVMNEVMALFPSTYIHVGGDECPKNNWKRCSLCQQRMKTEGLKNEHELQSYFIQRVEKYLNSKGKTLIGWDEILEGGLAPNAVVMSWRGESGGIEAAEQSHHVIMSPNKPVYFDHSPNKPEDSLTIGGYNSLNSVYMYEPVPQKLSPAKRTFIMGAQANVWTEYMDNFKKVEYMIFPRMSALSEVLWSSKEKRNWNDFSTRLQEHKKRYELWNIAYNRKK